MKNILATCLLLFIYICVFSQNNNNSPKNEGLHFKPISIDILRAQFRNEKFISYNIFSNSNIEINSELNNELSSVVDSFAVISIDSIVINKLCNDEPNYLALSLKNYDGISIDLLLMKHKIGFDGTKIKSASKVNVDEKKALGIHYWGIIKSDPNATVAISVFENNVMGLICSQYGNIVIGKIENSDKYIVYNDINLKVRNEFECGNNDENIDQFKEINIDQSRLFRNTINCVKLYWEINYDVYLDKGSIINAANYATGIFNQSQLLYSNDNIDVSLNELIIWDIPSPYIGTTTSVILSQFQTNVLAFNGDLGHLLGYQGGGGLAATIMGLCGSWNDRKCYSGIGSDFDIIPNYSWTINVVTHEQGHLMGSHHTHACCWNGNNTAIDGCGPSLGYTDMSCGSCPVASVPTFGTIMSYCHLTTNIDFNLGFGPQPAAVIINSINNSACLTPCSSCVTPINDNCANAILIDDNSSCVFTSGTVDCATDDGFPVLPTCNGGSATQSGVFYRFVAQSTNATIQVNPTNTSAAGLDAVIVLYGGANCFNLIETSGGCVDDFAEGVSETLNATGLSVGSTYWLRIYDWGSFQPAIGNGGFEVCITHSGGCANYQSTPSSASFSSNVSNGTFTVSAVGSNCFYSVASNCAWINNVVAGTGGIVTYNVDANNTCSNRNCTISVFDGDGIIQSTATYTINQIGLTLPSCGGISGSTTVCQSSAQTYSISCSNATSYNWTVPSDWTIISGQGTSSISVAVGSTSGQVCVRPDNGSCPGSQVCSNVSVNQAPSCGGISGSTTVCQSSIQTYSISCINATSYNWTVPSDWTIISGQGTSSISVAVGSTSGQVCVRPDNGNCPGSQVCSNVTVNQAPSCGGISGSTTVCQSSTQTYSISCSNATSYNWTVPSDWTIITGQGTSSINVTAGFNLGQICVTASNGSCFGLQGCSSNINTYSVDTSVMVNNISLTAITGPANYVWLDCNNNFQVISGANNQSFTPASNGSYAVQISQNGCTDTSSCYMIIAVGISQIFNANNISIYPNPTNDLLNIQVNGLSNGMCRITLTNTLGQIINEKVFKVTNISIETQFDMKDVSSGIYFLGVTSNEIKQTFKIQKQ